MSRIPDVDYYRKLAEPWIEKSKPVKTVLVGESPPCPKGGDIHYFYDERDERSAGLARSIARLLDVPTDRTGWKRDFLETFSSRKHFALVDLCEVPINHLKDGAREEMRKEGSSTLRNRLDRLQPVCVVPLFEDIDIHVRRVIQRHYRMPEIVVKSPWTSPLLLRKALQECR